MRRDEYLLSDVGHVRFPNAAAADLRFDPRLKSDDLLDGRLR
ncbi:hypothetical protein [Sorangium cellulosum]|nr:hypothetical protein [Sorangium cellulosum]